MFIVMGILFGGIATGYLLRRAEPVRRVGSATTYTILLLLFLLGVSVGTNRRVVENLASLGGEALLLSVAATVGSLLAAWAVYRLFFREREKR